MKIKNVELFPLTHVFVIENNVESGFVLRFKSCDVNTKKSEKKAENKI